MFNSSNTFVIMKNLKFIVEKRLIYAILSDQKHYILEVIIGNGRYFFSFLINYKINYIVMLRISSVKNCNNT